MDPTWNWANYGQIQAQNYYAAARQLRGAQSGTNSGQGIVNTATAQNHHTNQNQMSYSQNQMPSWFALHPHAHSFNASVHQTNNHTDPTGFAANPFGIHTPQSATHPSVASYDASGFLTGFPTAAATAAAKANYLQPNHANFKQLAAKDYEMNLRAASFATHTHCMQNSTHGASMTHADTSGMSAAPGAHLFPHLPPSSWRHHPNLMATHNHSVARTGPFGPLPHEESNLMQTRTAHHSTSSSMSAHVNSSSGHTNKSCSVESSKQLQHHQKHSSSSALFNQTVHSAVSRTAASTFDHFSSPKLAHHNQQQADHHYLAMQAAAAAVGMAAGPNQHMLTNSRTSTQCQYPSAMNFQTAEILMAVGSTPSMSKHSSNNQCQRGSAVSSNNNYCNFMMNSVANINNYSQNLPHASVSMSGSIPNHGSSSRSSSAASNHALQQGSESSSGSYGYNSPSANHPNSPFQQRNTASVASVSGSSQATTATAVAATVSNNVQDFTGTTYLNQGNAYAMNNSSANSTRIDYPTPPSSAQIVPQTQPGATQGQDDSLSHYPATQTNTGNSYPSNSYSPYPSKMSNTGPGSNNSVVSNTGSSSCMVEAAARAAAASNNSNSSAAYHHTAIAGHNTSLSEPDADACLSNIVNVTPISDGMSDIGKLNDSQLNSTLNDVLNGQAIEFQNVNCSSLVEQTVNFPPLRLENHATPPLSAKKKNKVKKKKKDKQAKPNDRVAMNANTSMPFSLPLHYNYNDSFASQNCNSYPTAGLHQTSTSQDQHIHTQSNILPTINDVAETAQCFDPSSINMQSTLIDSSLSAHINSQQQQQQQQTSLQHSQQQPQQTHQQSQQQQQQQTSQRTSLDFDKSQQQNAQQSQTIVDHQATETNQSVLQQAEDTLVNDKDLIPDLEDDLRFLAETANECEPPASNDIGTQAGNHLISEQLSNSVVETSSVATSTECSTSMVETCSTATVLSPVLNINVCNNNNNDNSNNNINTTISSSLQNTAFQQQNYYKFVQNTEDPTTDSSLQVSQTNSVKNETQTDINTVSSSNKKKKNKDTAKETPKHKSENVVNGVKSSKPSKVKCANASDNFEKTSKSLLSNANNSGNNNRKVCEKLNETSVKKTSDREHEAKFFKVRTTLNTNSTTTQIANTNSMINSVAPGFVVKEKNAKKRRLEEFQTKSAHDEYEFPDSPNQTPVKKSKKVNSNEILSPSALTSAPSSSTMMKKKASDKLNSSVTISKKSHSSSKNKSASNIIQTPFSTNKQHNNVNCDTPKVEFKHAVNINVTITSVTTTTTATTSITNCGKPEVTIKNEKRVQENQSEKQEHTHAAKQKTPHAQLHQQKHQQLPSSQPPSLQQAQQQQQPTTKKSINETKSKKESSAIAVNTVPTTAHNITAKASSQSVSVQSAGTNTPRRRSQDKKALTIREGLMRTGDFVVSLDEMNCELPMIWRIEGKSLLQRFEPSEQDSNIVYTNTSSYSAWNPTVRQRYIGVDVRIMGCSRTKIVVEKLGLTKSNPNNVNGDSQAVDRCKVSSVGSSDQHQENFEVFIQTLISQALDPNFIAEIVKENDEYFLTHVQAIDEVCARKKSRFFSKVKWDANVVKCVETFPTFTVIPQNNVGDLRCRLCHDNWSTQILHFSGEHYDQITLECKEAVDFKQTKYAACDQCKDRITLFSRLHHQKHNFYIKCKEKVDEMRAGDEDKESHVILEECLRDTKWIQSLFKQLEKIWIECDEMR